MSNLPTIRSDDQPSALQVAGTTADHFAASNVFEDYRQRVAANTLRRQDADLALFAQYLLAAGISVSNLSTSAECWRGMSWGIVQGFVQW